MELESIRLTDVIPVAPARLYEAWLDAAAHSAMTGSPATVEPTVGGKFSAWDDYITGENVELVPGQKIVQRWRAQDFPVDAAHSLLAVTFEEDPGGTLVTIEHTELPEPMGKAFTDGWVQFYFKPMKKHFKTEAKKAASEAKKADAAKKAEAKKAAPKKTAKKAEAKKAAPKKTAKKAAPKKGAAGARRAAGSSAKSPSENPPPP